MPNYESKDGMQTVGSCATNVPDFTVNAYRKISGDQLPYVIFTLEAKTPEAMADFVKREDLETNTAFSPTEIYMAAHMLSPEFLKRQLLDHIPAYFAASHIGVNHWETEHLVREANKLNEGFWARQRTDEKAASTKLRGS